jgi:GT2 family glycosyltransferase
MIHIILPIHNNLKHIKPFIACLKKQTYQDFGLFVIDSSSTDGGSDYIHSHYPSAIIFAVDKNTYWGSSLHVAHRLLIYSEGDYVLIINVDCVFGKEFLQIGIANCCYKNLVVATARSSSGEIIDGGVHVDWSSLSFTLTEHGKNIASTRGLFMLMKDFSTSGGFHPFLLPHYCSDYEFTHRLVTRGFLITTPSKLTLTSDANNTGNNAPKNLRELFSIKCPNNPVYKTIFILLSCPIRYWAINILRAWSRIIK